MANRRGYQTIVGVQDPDEVRGVDAEAYLSLQALTHFQRYFTDKAEDLAAVVQTLREPARWFETNRSAEEPPFGFCYIASPMPWKSGSGEVKKLPKGKALFVYVNSQMEVYDWRFEVPPPIGDLPVGKDGLRFARELTK